MDVLIGLAILIGLCSLLAILVRVVLVFVAKKRGYTPEEMPTHYHFIGVGAYFTVFWIMLFVLYLVVGKV